MSNEKLVRKVLRTLPKRFAHKVECPNYIKKQSKSYCTTLSDDETDEEEGNDNKVSNFVAFTVRNLNESTGSPTVVDHVSDNLSDDEEELTKEELMANYQMLF
ncbi:hypothetical protein LIER_19800 [Lithospermum erythrorhizon]|uniref:Gag-pol polyprotein n=1 Tax=Lithospermum erythrorhizon TaxID=34254 RepID=A0AAV3QLM9_LITER